jgi:hypothetical protein
MSHRAKSCPSLDGSAHVEHWKDMGSRGFVAGQAAAQMEGSKRLLLPFAEDG